VRAGWPRRALVIALVALYVALHGLFGLLTFTPWLDWSGLTAEYVLPKIGLTTAFTFLRLVHFSVDYAQPAQPAQPPPDLLTFSAWCLFFPTFVHLPLIRYPAWAGQFSCLPRRLALRDLGLGIYRIGQSLFKGVLIAIAFVIVNPHAILLAPAGRGAGELFAAAILSAVLYYVGFSAFMDLGIGAARLFGIVLPENFAPVCQMIRINRLRDFWRNWNITTTRWMNDYVYQPLGGHRHHPVRNVMLTMLACGLWHSVSLLGRGVGARAGPAIGAGACLEPTAHPAQLARPAASVAQRPAGLRALVRQLGPHPLWLHCSVRPILLPALLAGDRRSVPIKVI